MKMERAIEKLNKEVFMSFTKLCLCNTINFSAEWRRFRKVRGGKKMRV